MQTRNSAWTDKERHPRNSAAFIQTFFELIKYFKMSSVEYPYDPGTVVAACFLCQNVSASATTNNCNKLVNNLKVIFLLRELLGISIDLCAKYLQKYGEPSTWIHICCPCEEVITEGRTIFLKIKQLEEQFKEVKTKVRVQLKVKSELDVVVPEAGKDILQDFLLNGKVFANYKMSTI
jgi:hypothetical protein